jgi:hypothetical protein
MTEQQPTPPEPSPPPREPLDLDTPQVDWFQRGKDPRDVQTR